MERRRTIRNRRKEKKKLFKGETRFNKEKKHENEKIENLIRKIDNELKDSIEPITIPELNAFERKLIHRHFDHNPNVVTKTHRIGDEGYELLVYPVGNLKRYAKQKAEEAVEKRQTVTLPHMSNYERFIVHDSLKSMDTVNTTSVGEGDFRHIEIEPEIFGRGLKRIIKKIKLM